MKTLNSEADLFQNNWKCLEVLIPRAQTSLRTSSVARRGQVSYFNSSVAIDTLLVYFKGHKPSSDL